MGPKTVSLEDRVKEGEEFRKVRLKVEASSIFCKTDDA
jgi:hypothetical protein